MFCVGIEDFAKGFVDCGLNVVGAVETELKELTVVPVALGNIDCLKGFVDAGESEPLPNDGCDEGWKDDTLC